MDDDEVKKRDCQLIYELSFKKNESIRITYPTDGFNLRSQN